MRTYRGTPPHTVTVLRDTGLGAESYELPLRLDLRNHSPTGFSWGYGGSGPSQLALAILADLFDAPRALRFYQDYKFRVIAPLPGTQPWEITEEDVRRVVQELEDAANGQT